MIVQNLPVPLDRRVWLECRALVAAGYQVSVICPQGPGDPTRHTVDGVALYKYRPAPQARGVLGFVWEFVYSWVRTAVLSLAVRRERGFDVVQACNPPDTYWALALLWRLRGVRFVFDHHDLNPELFLSRFGEPTSAGARAQLAGLRWLERRTFRAAHRVISTNESYRAVAVRRGGVDPRHTAVVRSGPDTRVMRPVRGAQDVARGRHLLVYLGIMGPQDDVDVALRVVHELVHVRGRRDVGAALLGFGDCEAELRALSRELDLDDVVEFTGRAGKETIVRYLSAASVGLCPDRKTPLNDISTMNKTMEYMAFAVPAVTFDLVEARASAGDTALYVGSVAEMADAVERLLDDADLRVGLSLAARERCVAELDWSPQAATYVSVFDAVTGHVSGAGPFVDPAPASSPEVVTDEELEAFVRARGVTR
ncbi:glycosyltransferase family 4 protein [Cellulomonas soli]|uniref:Glycosyltransferase WbuB n=1 Tax=Cellulomonas soli TaxID=931535 RepID=A0A512PH38_9CELL|nr:glycosyltransferase family 4 protein [Cellulomonas soli]NYI59711.1 glycosyltransferase involved in cell wall biosynthesis [Cellulomonas soli]GEP70505.1 glycosyltransferase WbuB [Cellulomonas soli]